MVIAVLTVVLTVAERWSDLLDAYDRAMPFWQSYQGLRRYWDLRAAEANDTMSRVVYLPVYPAVPTQEIERMARAVTGFARAHGQAGRAVEEPRHVPG